MAEDSVITEELRRLLQVEMGPKEYRIDKGMLERFAEAIDDSNPLWKKMAPPTLLSILRLEELTEQVWNVKSPLTRKLNAGNELEYFQPIRIGDTISVSGKLVDLREREGKKGKMLIMNVDLTYKNQNNDVVAKLHRTLIRW